MPFLQCPCVGGPKPSYVRIKIGDTTVAETRHESSRVWNQTFRILCGHSAYTVITLALRTAFSTLGEFQIPASALLLYEGEDKDPNDALASRFLLKGSSNTNLKLHFSLRFQRAEPGLNWGRGLRFARLVHGATFPQRPNCSVFFYQDAHHGRGFHPLISLGTAQPYTPRRLWEDVYKAIDGARNIIYIAGWSVNPKLVLVSKFISPILSRRFCTSNTSHFMFYVLHTKSSPSDQITHSFPWIKGTGSSDWCTRSTRSQTW